MKKAFCFILFIIPLFSFSQFTDRYWCFGDSAGINFQNLNNPTPAQSILRSRGTCTSICDSAGNLLFYAATPNPLLWLGGSSSGYGYVINKNHQIMERGDSLSSSAWYMEMTIVPDPSNQNRFYLFHIGVTQTWYPGLYYSLIDLSYNNGLGKVVQKNVQIQSFPVCDGIASVKHGNGRDWWLFLRRWDPNGTTNNDFYSYLITPYGVIGPNIQNVGHQHANGFTRLVFSKDGSKLYCCTNRNLLEVYDFDRCSGIISNPWTIDDDFGTVPQYGYWSIAVSPDKSKLYLTTNDEMPPYDKSFLMQYNLNDIDPLLTADTLIIDTGYTFAGLVRLAPDDKIYFSSFDNTPDSAFFYLYDSAHYNTVNMFLSVINQPDSLGSSCQFQPFSFYLGGKRTYYGLPNNANYELTAWGGSVCDTLGLPNNSEQEFLQSNQLQLNVFYHNDWKTAFINASGLKGKNYSLHLVNLESKELVLETGKLSSAYFLKDIRCDDLNAGVYFIFLDTEKERLVKKFIID